MGGTRTARLAAILALCGAATCAAQPVAVLTDAQGPYRVQVGGRPVAADLLMPIERDAILTLAAEARVVLAYTALGSVFELRGAGRFQARSDAAVASGGRGRVIRRDLGAALRALKIRPDTAALQGAASMRGTPAVALDARGPLGSQLEQDPLQVCWTAPGAHWRYRVRLLDDQGRIVHEWQTQQLAQALTATLRSDAPYLWQLVAQGPDGRSAQAVGRFQRLDEATGRALRQLRTAGAGGDATARALAALAWRQYGFIEGGRVDCRSPDAAADR